MARKHVAWLSLLAVFLLCFCLGKGQLKAENHALHHLSVLREMEEALLGISYSFDGVTDRYRMSGQNMTCLMSILNLLKDKRKAMLYLDAAGKPQSGISLGNLAWLGSFDSCEDISDSHYCLVVLNVTLPGGLVTGRNERNSLMIRWGTCVPNSCGIMDLPVVMEFLIPIVKSKISNVTIEYKRSHCPERPKYTNDVIAALVFCGLLLLLCLLGTVTDMIIEMSNGPAGLKQVSTVDTEASVNTTTDGSLWSSQQFHHHSTDITAPLTPADVVKIPSQMRPRTGICVDFLLCFSLVRSTKKIFDTKIPSVAITTINGVRVISMFWVILGHIFLVFFSSSIIKNPIDGLHDTWKVSMMVITNAYFSVDSFFFLSGLLVAYTCFRKLEKSNGRFNWILFYFHRFWRLTPSLMFVILFSVKIKPLLIYSPLWNSDGSNEPCVKYWWTNLIYINNFYPRIFFNGCLSWTWYLANDMQFYAVTPLLLILAYRFGWRGLLGSAGSLLLASSITIASLIGYYNLDPMALGKFNRENPFDNSDKVEFENKVYTKPYCRVQPYIVGFILGYFMYRSYCGTRRPGWIVALIGWLVAAGIGLSLVYGPHDNVVPDGRKWSIAEKVIYGTLERLLWGVALAWVTYACHYGYGGLIQKFLSAKFWIPLSRLTYSAYLLHPFVVEFMFIGAKSTMYYSTATISYYFIAAVVLSYGAAFILATGIEFPCDNLENMALKCLRKRT